MPSYYELLEVEPSAGHDAIRSSFRRLAHRFHPDHNASPDAAERFRIIREAYDVLSDPALRRAYDLRMRGLTLSLEGELDPLTRAMVEAFRCGIAGREQADSISFAQDGVRVSVTFKKVQ